MAEWTKIDNATPTEAGKYEVTIEYEGGSRENVYAYWVQCASGLGGWKFQSYPCLDYSTRITVIAWKPFSPPFTG